MEEKKKLKAKELSKWGMVLAVVWVIVMMVLKAIWGAVSPSSVFGLSTAGILSAGAVIVILFTPVYRSIWIDKYLKKKEE